jgi:ABC-type Na+ efflux pump permease subunit
MAYIAQPPSTTGQSSPGGINAAKILGFTGLALVSIAAILAFFLSVRDDAVFYLWIAGLIAQFAGGLWFLKRRFLD